MKKSVVTGARKYTYVHVVSLGIVVAALNVEKLTKVWSVLENKEAGTEIVLLEGWEIYV